MKYQVSININADYECVVEADCEDEAYEAAMEECASDMGYKFNPLEQVCFGDCYIYEFSEDEVEQRGNREH